MLQSRLLEKVISFLSQNRIEYMKELELENEWKSVFDND